MRACLLVVALGGVAGADPLKPVIERAKLEIQPPGKGFKQITIENPLGDVKVEGYDGKAIQIETRKAAPDDEGLDRLRISLVPNPDGTVRISTTVDTARENRVLARGAVKIDLVVRAPRDARIEATSSSGAVEVSNMDAGGEVDTASGRITMRNVQGEVATHTVSGQTSLVQVFGSVDVQSLASDLDLESINGESLVASANRGKIAGRRVKSRRIELTTMDGKISLEGELSLHSRIVVASAKGDIEIKMKRKELGPLVVRGRGEKVALGAASKPQPDGWVEAQHGKFASGAATALVEMRAGRGIVQFSIIE